MRVRYAGHSKYEAINRSTQESKNASHRRVGVCALHRPARASIAMRIRSSREVDNMMTLMFAIAIALGLLIYILMSLGSDDSQGLPTAAKIIILLGLIGSGVLLVVLFWEDITEVIDVLVSTFS